MTNRIPLIAGNWKMNLDHQQAIALVQKLAWSLKDAGHDYKAAEVAVFPPFTDITNSAAAASSSTSISMYSMPSRFS